MLNRILLSPDAASAVAAPPAPAKPAAVAAPPAAAPSPNTEKPPSDYMGDIGNDLADLDKETADTAPPRDSKGRIIAKPKAETKPDAPASEPKEEAAIPAEEEPKPGTMRALGKAYDALKEERDKVLRPKLQATESRVAQLERELADARKAAPDVKPIQERASALEQENATLKEEIRYQNYKKHPEFKEKYEKPYDDAWHKAVGEISQFNITTEDGSTRKATGNDFLTLANAPLDQVDELAEKWFGRAAPRVIRHVEKIRDLAEAQENALSEARKNGAEREKHMVTEVSQRNAAIAGVYTAAQKEITEKYPKWFGTDPEDAPGNELLQKGFAYADSVLAGTGKLTPEAKVKRLAVIRAKSSNHDRLAYINKGLRAENAELKADLKEYRKSEPAASVAGDPGATGTKSWDEQVEAELRSMDK